MADSPRVLGSHVLPSPSGLLLACIVDRALRISYTKAPEQCIDFSIWCTPSKIKALRWARDSSRVLIFSSTLVEIVDLEDDKNRARLDNGTGGLGRFEAAEFLDHERIVTVWEYGRAKVWNLVSGRTQDIENIKTLTDGRSWAHRPNDRATNHILAYISRPAADDLLGLHLENEHQTLAPSKIPTNNAQSISWSPDGRWIAVLDSPQYSPGLHLFTADGHHFRSYSSGAQSDSDISGLGIKSVVWSPDSQSLAVARYDSHLELVAARTLSLVAVVEHSTTINQDSTAPSERVTIWQESVEASGVRSYTPLAQPVQPPLSRIKPSKEPRELGVATAAFSCDGKYLATMDESLLSTVWIWDVGLLRSRTVLIQHNNVKKLQWHTKIPNLLLLDCGENIAYLFDVDSNKPPTDIKTSANQSLSFTLLPSHTESTRPSILAASKDSFQILFPHGRDADDTSGSRGAEDDSIFEVLSGRRDHPGVDLSYTQRIALEAENDGTARIDDTFVVKQNAGGANVKDALDDSDIF